MASDSPADTTDWRKFPRILEAIAIKFTEGRPKHKLRVFVQVEDRKEGAVGKDFRASKVNLNAKIHFASHPRHITVKIVNIRKRDLFGLRKPPIFADVSVEFADFIFNGDVHKDGAEKVEVQFTFSEPVGLRMMIQGAKEVADRKMVILEKIGKFRYVIQALPLVKGIAEHFWPPAEALFTALDSLVKQCEQQQKCREAALDLLAKLDDFSSITEQQENLWSRKDVERGLEDMLNLIAETVTYVVNQTSTEITGDLFSSEYKNELEKFQKKYETLKIKFFDIIAIDTHKIAVTEQEMRILRDLELVKTSYNRDKTCLPGTRVSLRGQVELWARGVTGGPDSHRIFWLNGFAGSGKSAVAHSVARTFEEGRIPFVSFFCNRDNIPEGRATSVLPTLACQLAHLNSSYRADLLVELGKPHAIGNITKGSLDQQMEHLFPTVQTSNSDSALFPTHVVVIDALDETDDPAGLAKYLVKLVNAMPWVRVFVTSRRDPGIHDAFEQTVRLEFPGVAVQRVWREVNINKEADITADIQKYIQEGQPRPKLDLEPYKSELVVKAGGLFIWIKTVFAYLAQSPEPQLDLELFLDQKNMVEPHANMVDPLANVYDVYDKVLTLAVPSTHTRGVSVMHDILGMIAVTSTTRPLSTDTMATLLSKNLDISHGKEVLVCNYVKQLHAVLIVEQQAPHVIRPLHKSFIDFVLLRMQNQWVDAHLGRISRIFAVGCLCTLDSELEFNIAELDYPSVPNHDVPDLQTRIEGNVSDALQYSSRFWITHLLDIPAKDLENSALSVETTQVKDLIHSFLCSPKVFLWLEVVTLLNATEDTITLLHKLAKHLKTSLPKGSLTATDLSKFLSSFSEALVSTLHLYVSALSWIPKASTLVKDILHGLESFVVSGRQETWDQTLWVKHLNDQGRLVDVIFSPDGGQIWSYSEHNVYIQDAMTGRFLRTLELPHQIRGFGYTTSGSHLVVLVRPPWYYAEVPSPGEIYFCHPQTSGATEFTRLDVPTGISCFSLFPSGTRVVLGLDSGALQVWDLSTQTAMGPAAHGSATVPPMAVAVSPSARRIMSGYADGNLKVEIWELAQTTDEPRVIKTFECDKDESPVSGSLEIRWSPDGNYVVLTCVPTDGLRSNICIHSQPRTDIERRIVTPPQFHAAKNCVWVRLEDVQYLLFHNGHWTQRGVAALRIDPSIDNGHAVSSHCYESSSRSEYGVYTLSTIGRRIAIGQFDGTILIMNTDKASSSTSTRRHRIHETEISLLRFSPDGQYLVSYAGGTIRLTEVDACAADLATESDDIQADAEVIDNRGSWLTRYQAVYSPTMDCFAVWDHSGISLYDAKTAQLRAASGLLYPRSRQRDSGSPGLLHFSPEGIHVAATILGETWNLRDNHRSVRIYIWNINTGEQKRVSLPEKPLESGFEVTAIALRPGGTQIAIAETRTGSSMLTMMPIHDNVMPLRWSLPRSSDADPVLSIAFSPNGKQISSVSEDDIVCVWDADTGREIWRAAYSKPKNGRRPLGPRGSSTERGLKGTLPTAVKYAPGGARIACIMGDHRVLHVWEANTGAVILKRPLFKRIFNGPTVSSRLDYSRDGKWLAITNFDSIVRILDADSGETLHRFGPMYGDFTSVSFYPGKDSVRVLWSTWDRVGISALPVLDISSPWGSFCENMDEGDGWIKDMDGRLLFWVPHAHRYNLRRCIVWSVGKQAVPEEKMVQLDWQKLDGFRLRNGSWRTVVEEWFKQPTHA